MNILRSISLFQLISTLVKYFVLIISIVVFTTIFTLLIVQYELMLILTRIVAILFDVINYLLNIFPL